MFVAAIASLAGSVIGAMGAMASAKAQANMYTYQAEVAQVNQQITEQQRANVMESANQQMQQQAMQAKAKDPRAAFAGMGLDVGSGSPLETEQSAFRLGQFNETQVYTGAQQKSHDLEVQAMNFGAESQLAGIGAQAATTTGGYQALGGVLTGAGSVAGKWYQYSGSPAMMT